MKHELLNKFSKICSNYNESRRNCLLRSHTEHRDASKNVIDKCKSEKYASYELEVLAIEKMQQNDIDIKRIFYLAEAVEIDGYVARNDIPFKKVDNDLWIDVSFEDLKLSGKHMREKSTF